MMTQSYLEGENYPVRPAVYEQWVSSRPVVRTVSYEAPRESSPAPKAADSVSASGARLSWVPVHSSQGEAILRNREADSRSVDEVLNSLTVESSAVEIQPLAESRPAELPALAQRKWVGAREEGVTLTPISETADSANSLERIIPRERNMMRDAAVMPATVEMPVENRDGRVVPVAYVQTAAGRTVLTLDEGTQIAQNGVDRGRGTAALNTLENVPNSGPRTTSPLPTPTTIPPKTGGFPSEGFLDREGMTFLESDIDADMTGGYLDESDSITSPRAIGPGGGLEGFRSDDITPPGSLPPSTGRALPGAGTMPAPRVPYLGGPEPGFEGLNGSPAENVPPQKSLEDRCPSPKEMKPIHKITNNIRPPEGDFPMYCPLVTKEDRFPVRQFAGTQFTWTASNVCHNPLYFEQPDVERYGHSAGPVLQPILSGAQFILTIPYLPALVAMNPPNECQYPLGHYRPGSCAPYMFHPLPVSVRGLIAEGGIIAGLVFLIP